MTVSTNKSDCGNLFFAEMFGAERRRLGLTQGKFAEIYGITKGYVSKLEAGEKAPSATLRLLFEALQREHASSLSLVSEIERSDQFDQVLDGFFDKVKAWIAEEEGRTMNSALEFIEEFNDNFDDYVDWRKKQTGRNVVPGPPPKVSNSGK